ncbi:hypothetical protein K7432_007935 [Basidiobolus ranarum]|uniref:ABC1 atypical kinase-like domain-containing protein n=1 Tax=Basidiobolus ranarum TaxID=34480 RepID=A0ABR2WSK8_9FUNG
MGSKRLSDLYSLLDIASTVASKAARNQADNVRFHFKTSSLTRLAQTSQNAVRVLAETRLNTANSQNITSKQELSFKDTTSEYIEQVPIPETTTRLDSVNGTPPRDVTSVLDTETKISDLPQKERVTPTKETYIDSVPIPQSFDAHAFKNVEVKPIESLPHEKKATPISLEASSADTTFEPINAEPLEEKRVQLKESKVPTSRIGRMWQYGSLGVGIGFGAVGEAVRRATGNSSLSGNLFMSEANVDRLVTKLSRMRGAALKLGQMNSIQDNKMLPSQLQEILTRVQNSANYMPQSQLETIMKEQLGSEWRERFLDFDTIPVAAASIGQVHKAKLLDNSLVAVKVQYPGVAKSIDGDLKSLKSLLMMSSLLPKGLYLDNSIKAIRRELGWECDYVREAKCIETFQSFLKNDPHFDVPKVYLDLSTSMILTTEFMDGVPLNKAARFDQQTRNMIGEKILRLCLRELFEFRYMQTDPNWTNFLYNEKTRKVIRGGFALLSLLSHRFCFSVLINPTFRSSS